VDVSTGAELATVAVSAFDASIFEGIITYVAAELATVSVAAYGADTQYPPAVALRTLRVAKEDRTLSIRPEDRTLDVAVEDRTLNA